MNEKQTRVSVAVRLEPKIIQRLDEVIRQESKAQGQDVGRGFVIRKLLSESLGITQKGATR